MLLSAAVLDLPPQCVQHEIFLMSYRQMKWLFRQLQVHFVHSSRLTELNFYLFFNC